MFRSAIVALLIPPLAGFADTIEVLDSNSRQEGVCVTETKTTYIVTSPSTTKTWSISKEKAKVTISEDHNELLSQWIKLRNTASPKLSLDPIASATTKDPQVQTNGRETAVQLDRDKPIEIRYHGNDIPYPDPATVAREAREQAAAARAARFHLEQEVKASGERYRRAEQELEEIRVNNLIQDAEHFRQEYNNTYAEPGIRERRIKETIFIR